MHAALHPSQKPCMPRCIPLTSCACWVQLDPWDAELANVPCWDADVRGGEALYIPRRWWHAVAALSASLSVSYWWT